MTTNRDHIISLAKEHFCRTEYDEYVHECYEFSEGELVSFCLAAQREAYEKAAQVCENRHWTVDSGITLPKQSGN